MTYFVTGATGFIGRNLVERLLEREGTIYVLVREGSKGRLEELRNRWGTDDQRVVGVTGDLSQPRLGVSDADLSRLTGDVDHLFHLAAIYDMTADAESQRLANVEGTRHMVEFAEAVEADRVHMVSSIAAAGLYKGTWREDMFDEAENLHTHPYFQTKHESEAVVRRECSRPWRVYRPGIVVGNSETGEMDKIDGPYYFFKLIRRLRNAVPQWIPMVGVEGREINLVPVDFVAARHGPHRPPPGGGRPGLPPHRPEPEDGRRGDRHLRPRGERPPVLGARPAGRGRGPRAAAQDPRDAAAGRACRGRRSVRLRHSAIGSDVRQLPDQLRQPAGPGGAQRHRHPGAPASGLRGQALGLLGASPRPRPVPRPHAGGGRSRKSRRRGRGDPGHRAADPRRAAAARAAGPGHGLARAGRSRPGGHGHRGIVRNRALGGVEDRRCRRHRAARRPDSGEAGGDQGADPKRRRQPPTYIAATCPTWTT